MDSNIREIYPNIEVNEPELVNGKVQSKGYRM
jgi:hypothetical protein